MSENATSSQEETSTKQTESMPSHEEKSMGMFCHLAAFAFIILPTIGHIIGPLVLWLVKKDDSNFIDYHGKESLNFQITMSILHLFAFVLWFIFVGIFITFGLMIFSFVMVIIAGIRANEGVRYQYPINFRFIK